MKEKKKQKYSSISNIFFMMKTMWQGSKGYVFYAFFKEITENIFRVFFSVYMTMYIYVSIENKTPFKTLLVFIGGMCLGHVCIHISSAFLQLCEKQFVPKIYQRIYKMVISKSVSMDYAQFERPDFYDKYTRAMNECQYRAKNILDKAVWIAGGFVSVIVAGGVVAKVDPILILFIVPNVVVMLFLGKKLGDLYYQLDIHNTRDGRVAGYTKRVFYEKKYASELRLFNMSDILLERHEKAYDNIEEQTRQVRKKMAVIEIFRMFIGSVFSEFVPYIYIALVLNNSPVLAAKYVGALSGLGWMTWTTSSLVTEIVGIYKESTFVSNIRDFLKIEPKHSKDNLKMAEKISDIEINNLTFTYEGAKNPTLKNVNMKIKKGEKIAIVGYNGAGKTTLVKLLMGLYEPTEGSIKLSGVKTTEYEPKSLHSRFGTVFQDLQVFALPLSHNVLMRKPKNDEERKLVEESLIKAQFGDKLKTLENGIDTIVTKEFDDKGMGLSGGEAQKIAIARVFARQPDVVILDEPSSALDPIAEYKMYENMLKATEGETVIFISHRLSATRDADRIYMFENGTIIEQGSHRELIELGGKYAEMWQLQAQNYLAV